MSNNLFYSENENIVFYVTDGYWVDNAADVSEFIKLLEEERLKFARMIDRARLDGIKSYKIETSRRYKYMRVFWVDNVTECPKSAYPIGFKETEETKGLKEIPDPIDGSRLKYQWSMHQWIHD